MHYHKIKDSFFGQNLFDRIWPNYCWPAVNFINVFFANVHVTRKKAAKTTFVRKKRAKNVDEIDTCFQEILCDVTSNRIRISTMQDMFTSVLRLLNPALKDQLWVSWLSKYIVNVIVIQQMPPNVINGQCY